MAVTKQWDLTGGRFGKLSVMWPACRISKKGRVLWALTCDCGTTAYASRDALIEGRVVSCGCERKRRAKAGLPALKHGLSRKCGRKLEATLYHNARQRAYRIGLECTITPLDIKVPDVCPVLGIKLEKGAKLHDGSPTLDRFDTSQGYTPENIRVISWRANRIKSDATAEELEKIIRYMGR